MKEFDSPIKDVRSWIDDEIEIEYPNLIEAMETAIEVAREETLKEVREWISAVEIKIRKDCEEKVPAEGILCEICADHISWLSDFDKKFLGEKND